MAKRQKTGEAIVRVKQDRLNRHLAEVEKLITQWIHELEVSRPFFWLESEESFGFGSLPTSGPRSRTAEEIRREPWKLWVCHRVYRPSVEEDNDDSYILRRHLRSSTMWRYHSDWTQLLNRIMDLAAPVCERANKMLEGISRGRQPTEDYKGLALQDAFSLALGEHPAKAYSQRGPRDVWYNEILIEKTASAEQMSEIAKGHQEMVSQLAACKEMLAITQEWSKALTLQQKVRALAAKALKSSDFLNPCQFCRRLW